MDVDGIGAEKLPVPPVATVYQISTPVPVALRGPDAAPKQNEVSRTVGVGGAVLGVTVSKKCFDSHDP